jgi:hypothetical protein
MQSRYLSRRILPCRATLCMPHARGAAAAWSAAQGFAVAAADGAVSLYEKDGDEARLYRCARRLPLDACGDALGLCHVGGRPRVRSLALSAAEDALLLALASCQLLSLNLGAAELAKARAPRLWRLCIAGCTSPAGQRVGDCGHARLQPARAPLICPARLCTGKTGASQKA